MKKHMKSIILILSLCIITITLSVTAKNLLYKGTSATASSPYLPKDNPLGAGVKNIMLIFANDTDTAHALYKNLITYIDEDGQITNNIFMDTFIIYSNTCLDALDKRIAIAQDLNETVKNINNNLKINVIFSDGTYNSCANNPENDYKNIVDQTIERFNNNNFSNLNLIGFWWAPESINIVNSTFSMVTDFNDYVHSLGYKTLWIPYVMGHKRYSDQITSTDLNYGCNNYAAGLNDEPCTAWNNGYNYSTINDGGTEIRMYRDELQMYGYKYGFDFVSIQTGHIFKGSNYGWNEYRSGSSSTTVSRLFVADYQVSKMHAGIEVELDPGSHSNGSYYGYEGCVRYKEWLRYAVTKEWNKSLNVYYIQGQFNDMYLNGGGIARDYYDTMYDYAKEQITLSDVDKISCDREYYSNYENISNGKSYDTNASKYMTYTDKNRPKKSNGEDYDEYGYYIIDQSSKDSVWQADNQRICSYGSSESNNKWKSNLYCDDGVKLTDGEYGKTSFSRYDEWVSFSNKTNKKHDIIIDLNTKTNSLTYFGIELNNHKSGGLVTISEETSDDDTIIKGSIKVFVSDSTNGEYTEVGNLTLMEDRNIFEAAYYELKIDNSVSGRYVKFEIESQSNSGLIFVSEAIVGRTSTIKMNSNESIIKPGESTTVNLETDNVNNLKVTVTDPSIATASVNNNILTITGINEGSTTITLEDERYGTKAIHEVVVVTNKKYKVKIRYNVNGGTLIDPHGADFEQDENGFILLLQSDIVQEIDYDGQTTSTGLYNYNNSGLINIRREGYKINTEKTWYKLENGIKTYYNQKGVVTAEQLCDASQGDCIVDLYANWIKEIYEITFDPLDGELTGSNILYIEYNSNNVYTGIELDTLATIPSVTKEEYIFIGWYTSDNKKVFNSNGTFVSNVDGYTDSSGKWIKTNNITLYAQYEAVREEPEEDTFEFDNDADYDVNDDILSQVVPGMDSEEIFNTINTNGILSIYDKDGTELVENIRLRTGYKLRATFTTKILEYKISVKGDVLGTGELSIANAKAIAKHVIDKNIITGEEYLLAADYDNNGEIKMNDVVKILKKIRTS